MARADLAAVLAHLGRSPPAGMEPLAAMRAMVEDYGMGSAGAGLAACRRVPVRIGTRDAEWLVPPAPSNRRIVYLHGGGWVAGSPASHRSIAAELALLSGQAVLLPDYRLAPEHPFPAGLDDAAAALVHAASHGPEGQGAAESLALAGDSAGANLAAVLALNTAPGRHIDRLLLISPFLSTHLVPDSFAAPPQDPAVSAEGMALVASLYAPQAAPDDVRIHPLLATAAQLAQLPPLLIQVSAAETLRAQSLAFAQRLWGQGQWARLSLWPDMPHVWHAFIGELPEAMLALEEAAHFLAA